MQLQWLERGPLRMNAAVRLVQYDSYIQLGSELPNATAPLSNARTTVVMIHVGSYRLDLFSSQMPPGCSNESIGRRTRSMTTTSNCRC